MSHVIFSVKHSLVFILDKHTCKAKSPISSQNDLSGSRKLVVPNNDGWVHLKSKTSYINHKILRSIKNNCKINVVLKNHSPFQDLNYERGSILL